MKVQKRQWVKIGVFCATGVACAVLMTNTLSVPVRGDTVHYNLEFTDVEGLNAGNPVTMSGVRVGRVDSIRFAPAPAGTAKAVVRIEVQRSTSLPSDVAAAVRYGDMLGARYLALTTPADPPRGADATLPADATIPIRQTTPPVNLTALLNGFKPLFDALRPEQVNALTRTFVETFSGQGGQISTLLTQIAAVSSDLGDQQEVFTALTKNLTTLLTSVAVRSPRLDQLIGGLNALSASVAGNSGAVDALLGEGNSAVAQLAASMARSNGDFDRTVHNLETMTGTWNSNTGQFNGLLTQLPQFADAINRVGSYGSFVSLYLCNFTLKAGDAEANIFGSTHSPVCS